MKTLYRLIHNIHVLGFKNGYYYWRLQNYTLNHPEKVPELIEKTRNEGRRLKEEHPEAAKMFLEWSAECSKSYKKFCNNKS